MCTVTFIPSVKDSGFFLTSNRDESPARSAAEQPRAYEHFGQKIFYPRDPVAGGTWIAASESNYTLCLLNGAFEKHAWDPPYRKSRGLVLLDFFKFNDPDEFITTYDFEGIEPFTLLMINTEVNMAACELRWDGMQPHQTELDIHKPFIRSSATLFTKEVIRFKEELFNNWIAENNSFNAQEVLDFHKTAGSGDPGNDFIMNRDNKVRTVSITQICRTPEKVDMIYRDLMTAKDHSLQLY